jgi:hypothetical protein
MSNLISGRVASLHLHPARGGEPMRNIDVIEVVAEKGIAGNDRYFGRVSRSTGAPRRRQVSLIEREQIAEHAANARTGKNFSGRCAREYRDQRHRSRDAGWSRIEVGTAVLRVYEPRTPCEKMDRICKGLRALMEDSKQGVLAEVVRGGTIRVGDEIKILV